MGRFGTAGIRGSTADDITPSLGLDVGLALGTYLRDADPSLDRTVVIGRDGRLTGPGLESALRAGLESAGIGVRLAGRVPTPALAFASRGRWGVMVTASHNPPVDNGFKLFRDGVEIDRSAEASIESGLEAPREPVNWHRWTAAERIDVLDEYRRAVVDFARGWGAPLEGLSIALDCGTGVASLAAPQVLSALGGATVALNATVDGHFPARESKPTETALEVFCRFVSAGPASLGIAHDGDADRVVVVDADGGIVHEDTVVAILAHRSVEESGADDPVVVTTPNASARIDDRVAAAGGRVERVGLGRLHEGIERVRATAGPGTVVAFAAEPWKHVHPGLGGWIDGVASAAVIARLVAEAGGLDPLREPVDERPYRKLAVGCPEERKAAAMREVEAILASEFAGANVETDGGLRIDLADGSWLLVRPSGTEPVIRIYVEAKEVGSLVDTVRAAVREAVDRAT